MSPIVRLETLQQFAAVQLSSDPGDLGGPLVIPNCVIIRIVWLQEDGKNALNILGGRTAGVPAPTVAQANAIHTALTTGAAWTALANQLHTSTSLSRVEIISIHSEGQPVVQSTNTVVNGTGTGSALPNEMAAVLTKRTALVGRANRGRIYVPGFAAVALFPGNIISATCVTALTNWGGTINAAISAGSYTHVILHPARGAYTGSTGTPHPARTAGFVDVTQIICRDNHWDNQRRRGLR